MRIIVVCNLNAARSVLIVAAMRKRNPGLKILSCGVNASTGKPYPMITVQTAVDWNLNLMENKSLNINDISGGLQNDDFIILTDDFMRDSVLLHPVDPKNVFSFSDLCLPKTLEPRDPVNLMLPNFKVEIAKSIFFAFLILSKFLKCETKQKKISVLVGLNKDESNLTEIIDYCKRNSMKLLNTDFSVPSHSPLHKLRNDICQIQIHPELGISTTAQHEPEFTRATILESRFEEVVKASVILSEKFRDSIKSLSENSRIILSPNFNSGINRVNEEQFLIASYAQSICDDEVDLKELLKWESSRISRDLE